MSVRITGVDELRAGLKEINDFLASPKPMQGFVADAKAEIVRKTEAGRDFKNAGFVPYSKAYAKAKGSARVNLTDTGTMLGNIFTEVPSARHGVIDVRPGAEPGGGINSALLANIHHTGTGKQPARPFMNLNDTQVAKLKKKHWDDKLLEMTRRLR